MTKQEKTASNRGEDWNVDITEFSVVLLATSNNPSILNPDFLQYNDIVDASQQIQEPPISTPAFSQVIFQDGLTVTADPDRVIFAQTRGRLATEDIVCPEIAKRYVKTVPHVTYRAVGINPKGFRRSGDGAPDRVANALTDKGAWLSFKDTIPEIQLKAVYRYSGRTIFLDVIEARREADGRQTPGILFQANIHRNITETNPQKRTEGLLSIIDSWKEDLSEFHVLVNKVLRKEAECPLN